MPNGVTNTISSTLSRKGLIIWKRKNGTAALVSKGFCSYFNIFSGSCNLLRFILITSLAHGLRLSDSGKDYLDSTAFANTLYDAAFDVMHGISGTFPYTNVYLERPCPK